jgi:ribosomal-protein-alanine N-acetyltransferase
MCSTFCVAPNAQGRGAWDAGWYCVCWDLARWHRAERVFLEVRPSNPRAIALYHDLGFNEIGRRPGYYPAANGREDALVMAIELLPDEMSGP